MALFYRASSNIYLMLNNSRCKFLFNHVGVISTSICLKQNFSSNNDVMSKIYGNTRKDKTQSHNDNVSFESIMKNRRNEAKRSILVQVYSRNTCNDLYNYCMKFGNVVSMHYFVTKTKKHMFLVEFDSFSTINDIKSNAIFLNPENTLPTKTSALWFRSSRNVEKQPTVTFDKYLVDGDLNVDNERLKHKLISAHSISQQVTLLHNELKLNDLCTRLRFYTASYLEDSFTGFFPNIIFHPFGSSVNGFGRKSCDLDLVTNLDMDNKESNSRLIFQTKVFLSNEAEQVRKLLNVISDSLNYLVPGIAHVRKILKARVPIIKLEHTYVDIECDLSLSNMSAVYMSELLYLYGEIDPRVRPLVITIRKWAECQAVTNHNPGYWITNFSLTLLVLFFLQNAKVLPSLNSLKKHTSRADERYVIDIGDCSFPRNVEKIKQIYKKSMNTDSLENLLTGFFEFYSKFDFDKNAVCIQRGNIINKDGVKPLHIINPLQSMLNVSPNVTLEEVLRFKALSHQALHLLQNSHKKHDSPWGLLSLFNENYYSQKQSQEIEKPMRLNKILENDSEILENDIDKLHESQRNFVKNSSMQSTAIKRR